MLNRINKNFFLFSFLLHLLFTFIVLFFCFDNKIHNRFIVFGAHSKKPTFSYFAGLKKPKKNNIYNTQKRSLQKINTNNINIKKINKINQNKQTNTNTKNISNINKISKISKIKKPIQKEKNIKKINTQQKIESKKLATLTTQTQETPTQIIKETKKQKLNQISKTKPEIYTEKLEQKKLEIKHEPKQKDIIQKDIIQEEIIDNNNNNNNNSENINTESDLHFDLTNPTDPDLVIYQKSIQAEVEKLWHPPIGIPKGTECTVSFVVNYLGEVESFEIIKHSKVLLYDLSISRIAKKFKFAECLWAKKFTIDFRQ